MLMADDRIQLAKYGNGAAAAAAFEAALGDDATLIGEVTNSHWLQVRLADGNLNKNVADLEQLWKEAIPCQLKSRD